MPRKRRLLSALVAFALAFSMVPVPAFAAIDAPGGAVMQDEDVAVSEGSTADLQESSDTAVESAEVDEFDSNEAVEVAASCIQGSLDDIAFVFVEWDAASCDEVQNIAIGFNDETVADDAILKVVETATGVEHEVEATEALAGAVKFTFEPGSLEVGNYYVASMRYMDGSEEILYDFTKDATSDYIFEIVDEVLEDSSEEEDVSVFTLDASGELVEQDSIESAIDEVDSQGVRMRSRSASTRAGNFVVVLDPGHGGSDPGASGNGIVEKTVNLKIAQYCRDELQKYDGVTVYMTRNSDVYVGLEERAELAKRVGADLFVSIHNNSAASSSGRGSEVIVPLNGSGTNVGNRILDQLAALGLQRRSVYTKSYDSDPTIDYYSVIRNTAAAGIPGIIVEHAFVSNPSDAAFLGNESNLQKLGIADATGIAQCYALSSVKRQNAIAFVTRLYEKVLGRTPDSSGLNSHVNAFISGASAADVAWGFFSSAEFTGKPLSNGDRVEIAYQTMLDRASDAAGKQDWTSKLDVGMSMRAVIAGFCGASEFRNLCARWSLTPGSLALVENRDKNYNATAFVQRLYQKVLGRGGDVSGLNSHTGGLLSGTTAADIAWGFFGSAEFANSRLTNAQRVEIAYNTMLDRAPDASGKADWANKLDTGMSMRSIIAGFSGSAEFRSLCARWGLNPGALSVVENRDKNYNATAFVQRLYQNVLGRGGDVSGLNSHTGALLSGTAAADVAWGFFGSAEFVNRKLSNDQMVEIAYQTLLDRNSDPDGKASWVAKLNNGMPLRLLIAGFVGSNEFQKLCASYGLRAGSIPFNAAELDRYSGYMIMGASSNAVIQRMVKYFQSTGHVYPANSSDAEIAAKYKSSDAPTISAFCTLVYNEATAEGVKPEVVFCQAMKETGWLQFGGSVDAKQFNFAGLGAVDNATGGATFPSVAVGLRAQVQHLKCYASTAPLKNSLVDPRWNEAVNRYGRGCAPTLEELNGKWAVPGDGYGQSIRSMIDKLLTY